MTSRHLAILSLAGAIIVAVFATGPASAGHEWIFLHHEDQGIGQPAFEQCMPIESWEGHEDHEGDWFEGPFDNEDCEEAEPTEEPTDEPQPTPTENVPATPTPQDDPGPSPTPTDTEPELTPTPTDPDTEPSPTPTDSPEVEPTPGLPSAGFTSQYEIMNGEPWQLTVPGNVWAGHNQEGWPAGEWWLLWEGREFLFNGAWYTTVEYIIADPTEVELIGRAVDFDLMLITCRNYNPVTNAWAERLVIFANLSP